MRESCYAYAKSCFHAPLNIDLSEVFSPIPIFRHIRTIWHVGNAYIVRLWCLKIITSGSSSVLYLSRIGRYKTVANIPASGPRRGDTMETLRRVILGWANLTLASLRRVCRFFTTVMYHVRLLSNPCLTITKLLPIYPNNNHFNCAELSFFWPNQWLRISVPRSRPLIIAYSQVIPLLHPRSISIDYLASSMGRQRARNSTCFGSLMQDLEHIACAVNTVVRTTGVRPRIFHMCIVQPLVQSGRYRMGIRGMSIT
jgi:hypothetical protein